MITLNDTIQSIRKKTAAKDLSADAAVTFALAQIQRTEARLHAFVVQVPYEQLARPEDEKRKDQTLAGVPFAVQDTICVKDLPLTCCAKILQGFEPGYDATAVARIRQQGGVLLGKLNCSEFALEPGSENDVLPKTGNPWGMGEGSASVSGVAAAVAAGQVWFSLGTDAAGELRLDATACGLTALKPTFPTVSKHGLAASVPSMAQIGVAARHVSDCEAVWHTLLGADDMDSTVIAHPNPDKDKPTDLTGIRIGIPTAYLHQADAKTQNAVKLSAERLRRAGALVEQCHVDNLEKGLLAAYVLQCAEASSSLARYDGVRFGYRNPEAKDVLSMYRKTRADGMSEETKQKVLAGTYYLSVEGYDHYYKQAARLRTLIAKGLQEAYEKYDCLLAPVHAGLPGDDPLQRYWPAWVNLAGLPALAFPGALHEGLPVGVQLIGKAYTEPLLFALAAVATTEIDWNQIPVAGQQSGGDR